MSRLIPKGKIGGSIVALAGSTAAAQVITACSMPIVTRLYSPAEIGVISLFIAFFGFWSALLSWRYESALLLAVNDSESHLIFRMGTSCIILMSFLSAPLLFILVSERVLGFGLVPLWGILVGIPIFLGYGLFMMYRSWGLRGGLVRDISKATVARSASNAIVRVALGIFGGGIMGLFVAEVAGAWGATVAIRRSIHKRYSNSHPLITWQAMKKVAARYAKFPIYEMPSVAVDQLTMALPLPIIAELHGASAAGWFGLARLLVAIPNAQIGRAVADVFQMELARYIRDGQHQAAYLLFFRILRKLSLFGLLPFTGMVILGPLLVPWIFGRTWAEMGVITAFIAPWMYAALVVSSLSRVLSVLERQEYKLIYDILALVLIVIAYVISRQWALNLNLTVALLSIVNIISYVIYLLVIFHVISKYLKVER